MGNSGGCIGSGSDQRGMGVQGVPLGHVVPAVLWVIQVMCATAV